MIGDSLDALEDRRFDDVIIGSGPAGLTLALELARLGRPSLVLESGLDAAGPAQSLSDATRVDPRRHDDMRIAVARRFGGTSNLWGGRCMPLDPPDFVPRAFAQQVRWPLRWDELAPWYAIACRYAECGEPHFELPLEGLGAADDRFSCSSIERASNRPRFQQSHREALARSALVDVRLGATVVELVLDADARVQALVVAAPDGRRIRVAARRVTIASGGLESTRLLLATQRAHPRLFGGADGPLGRYYMGHIIGEIADIVFRSDRLAAEFDFILDGRGSYARRRLVPSLALQQAQRLPNVCFWPVVPPVADARHRSGSLSAVAMALSTPVLGRALIPEAIRTRHVPDHIAWLEHLRNVAFDLPRTVGFLGGFVYRRYLASQRIPGYFVRNRAQRYGLSYHSEQSPRADSRVTLEEQADRFGLPRLRIDLRFHREDAEALVRAHEQLGEWLQAAGLAQLEYRQPAAANVDAVLAQAAHGTHQIGTARMGAHRGEGVVDADLRCFDCRNLFVLGSAVFPTSGQANPTLTIVALAARLAQTLAREDRAAPDVAAPVVAAPDVAAPAVAAPDRRVVLPGTALRLSRLVFGTGSLFNAGASARRQDLLAAAADQGFTHFDTAPYYGFGMAERDLAPLLRQHPELTVTTKVGLYPPGGADQPGVQVLARKVAGKLVRGASQPRSDFALERARASLEGSLRRLGRERIDLLLLHEPELAAVDGDAWMAWLLDCQARGLVGEFGIALTRERLQPFLEQRSPLARVVQTGDSLGGREADLLDRYGHPHQLHYGYVSAARAQGDTRPAQEILQAALDRHPQAAILVSTTRIERLAQYRRWLAPAQSPAG